MFEIIVDEENNSYTANEGILYNKAFTEILYVPLNIQGKVSIVEGVTKLAQAVLRIERRYGNIYSRQRDFNRSKRFCRMYTTDFNENT